MTTEGQTIGAIAINFMMACIHVGVEEKLSKPIWVEIVTNGERYQNNNENFKQLLVDNLSIDEYIEIINYEGD